MFSILISIPTCIAFVFMVKFFFRAQKGEKQYLFLALFMLLFVVVLVAMMLVSYAEGYEESIAIVDLFSLLFYVAILGIPATFYLYTISLSDIEFKNVGREKTLKHYFIPLLLLVINVFSFLYLSIKTMKMILFFRFLKTS